MAPSILHKDFPMHVFGWFPRFLEASGINVLLLTVSLFQHLRAARLLGDSPRAALFVRSTSTIILCDLNMNTNSTSPTHFMHRREPNSEGT